MVTKKRSAVRVTTTWRHNWRDPRPTEHVLLREIVPGPFTSPQLCECSPLAVVTSRRHRRQQRPRWANLRRGIPDPWAEYVIFRDGPHTGRYRVSRRQREQWSKQLTLTERAWKDLGVCMNQGIPDPWKNWPTTWEVIDRETGDAKKTVEAGTSARDLQSLASSCVKLYQAASRPASLRVSVQNVSHECFPCQVEPVQQQDYDRKINSKHSTKSTLSLKTYNYSETEIMATSLLMGSRKVSADNPCCRSLEHGVGVSVSNPQPVCSCDAKEPQSKSKASKMRIIYHPRSPLCMCRQISEKKSVRASNVKVPKQDSSVCDAISYDNPQKSDIRTAKVEMDTSAKNGFSCKCQIEVGHDGSQPKKSTLRIPIHANAFPCRNDRRPLTEPTRVKSITIKPQPNEVHDNQSLVQVVRYPASHHSKQNLHHGETSRNSRHRHAHCTCNGKVHAEKKSSKTETTAQGTIRKHALCTCACQANNTLASKSVTTARNEIPSSYIAAPLNREERDESQSRTVRSQEDKGNACGCGQTGSVLRVNVKPSVSNESDCVAYYALSYVVDQQKQNKRSKFDPPDNNNNKPKRLSFYKRRFSFGRGESERENEPTPHTTQNDRPEVDEPGNRYNKSSLDSYDLSNDQKINGWYNATNNTLSREQSPLRQSSKVRGIRRHSNPREKWMNYVSKAAQKRNKHPHVNTQCTNICSTSIPKCVREKHVPSERGHKCNPCGTPQQTANHELDPSLTKPMATEARRERRNSSQQRLSQVNTREVEETHILSTSRRKTNSKKRLISSTHLPQRGHGDNTIIIELPDLPDVGTLSRRDCRIGPTTDSHTPKQSQLITSDNRQAAQSLLPNASPRNIDTLSILNSQRGGELETRPFSKGRRKSEDVSEDFSYSEAPHSVMTKTITEKRQYVRGADKTNGKGKLKKTHSRRSVENGNKSIFIESDALCSIINAPNMRRKQTYLCGSANNHKGTTTKFHDGVTTKGCGIPEDRTRKSLCSAELPELSPPRATNTGKTRNQSGKSLYSEEVPKLSAPRITSTGIKPPPPTATFLSAYDTPWEPFQAITYGRHTAKLMNCTSTEQTVLLANTRKHNRRQSIPDGDPLQHPNTSNKCRDKTEACSSFVDEDLTAMSTRMLDLSSESRRSTSEQIAIDYKPSFTRLVCAKYSRNVDAGHRLRELMKKLEETQYKNSRPCSSLLEQSSYLLRVDELDDDSESSLDITAESQPGLPTRTTNEHIYAQELIDKSTVTSHQPDLKIPQKCNSAAIETLNSSHLTSEKLQFENSDKCEYEIIESSSASQMNRFQTTVPHVFPASRNRRRTDSTGGTPSRYPDESRAREARFRKQHVSRNALPILHPVRSNQVTAAPDTYSNIDKLTKNVLTNSRATDVEKSVYELLTSPTDISKTTRNDLVSGEREICNKETNFKSTASQHSDHVSPRKMLEYKYKEHISNADRTLRSMNVPPEVDRNGLVTRKGRNSMMTQYAHLVGDTERNWKEGKSISKAPVEISKQKVEKNEGLNSMDLTYTSKNSERDWKPSQSNNIISTGRPVINEKHVFKADKTLNITKCKHPGAHNEMNWQNQNTSSIMISNPQIPASSDYPRLSDQHLKQRLLNKPTVLPDAEVLAGRGFNRLPSSPRELNLKLKPVAHEPKGLTNKTTTSNARHDANVLIEQQLNDKLQPTLIKPIVSMQISLSNRNPSCNSDHRQQATRNTSTKHENAFGTLTKKYNDELEKKKEYTINNTEDTTMDKDYTEKSKEDTIKMKEDILKFEHQDPYSDNSYYWEEKQSDNVVFYADKEAIVISCSTSDMSNISVISKLSAPRSNKTVGTPLKSSMLFLDPLKLLTGSETSVHVTGKPSCELVTAERVQQAVNNVAADTVTVQDTRASIAASEHSRRETKEGGKLSASEHSRRETEENGKLYASEHSRRETEEGGKLSTSERSKRETEEGGKRSVDGENNGDQTRAAETSSVISVGKSGGNASEWDQQVSAAQMYLSHADRSFLESDFLKIATSDAQPRFVSELRLGEKENNSTCGRVKKRNDALILSPASELDAVLTRLFHSTRIAEETGQELDEEEMTSLPAEPS